MGCLFILFIVSFAVQNLLSLSRFVYFCFCFHYSRRCIKKDVAMIYARECSARFSSRSFVVSDLIFRFLIYFELIFVYVVKNDLI